MEIPFRQLRDRVGMYAFALLRVGVLGLVVFSTGCSGDAESTPSAIISSGTPTAIATTTPPIAPVLVNSVLLRGPNRIMFALLDRDRSPISDATVRATFKPADEGQGPSSIVVEMVPRHIEEEQQGAHEQHVPGDSSLTVYTADIDFARSGRWTVLLAIGYSAGPIEISGSLEVLEDSRHPDLGQRVPATEQAVLREGVDLATIDTTAEPDPALHDVTIAEALDLGRPLVIGFATPAFCQTRVCGPLVDGVLRPLAERYPDQVETIHVEPFDIPLAQGGRLQPVAAMGEWGLETEPWLFVTNADGELVARFEGPVTLDEIEGVLRSLGVAPYSPGAGAP